MRWWVLLILVAVVLGHGHLVPVLGWIAGGGIVAYLVSLQRHPRRDCHPCTGTGRHRGAMFTWGDRPCATCGGSGRHRRWGVQLLHRGPGQRAWAEQAAKDAAQRRAAPR